MVSHCGFNLHFLMTSDVEHHLVMLPFCVSSLVKYLFKSVAYFFNRILFYNSFFIYRKVTKIAKEFLYPTHPSFLYCSMLVCFIATIKPILVYYCLLKSIIIFRFPFFSLSVLCPPRIPPMILHTLSVVVMFL